eukprot:TRINITY_DN773_c0_g1_i1.p1 TRINITY_DN773_c0_g1~~TRINITY_DN773_c0_g1_i1.p1  ORF type:complete len:406 (+),score=128.09 TRINITY_DN773_c0_g1_i1:161-1378(+)
MSNWGCPQPSLRCAMGSFRNVFVSIPVFIVSGTFAVVLSKVLFGVQGKGRYGKTAYFEKPWFLDWGMFVGMVLCLFVFYVEIWYNKYTGSQPPATSKKLYWVIAIPALCDLVSTFMMNVGLLWIPGSIWQMLRGSIVIFTAFITVTYRKRRLYSSGWTGVAIVVIALLIVGGACFKTPQTAVASNSSASSGAAATGTSSWEMMIGIVLVILAQFIQAMQTIIEEQLLHDVKASPNLIVGMEGLWGFLLCTFISMPIAANLPSDLEGLYEDSIDSFIMIYNSPTILGLVIGYVAVILLFNIFGMIITDETSAMVRNLLEPVRTLFIWITDIFIGYVISEELGETVNWWSFLEGAGFIVLCVGVFIYNGIIKLPFLTYPPKDGESKEEQQALVHSVEEGGNPSLQAQ